jgi:hypothetical protein
MIDRGSRVAVTRQAELLDLSRSSVYYSPRALPDRDLCLMRRLDEPHLQHSIPSISDTTSGRKKPAPRDLPDRSALLV